MNSTDILHAPPEATGSLARMTVWVIRAFFLLISAGTGALIAFNETLNPILPGGARAHDPVWSILGMIGLFTVVMFLEMLLGSASDIAALVFGLVVGVILALLSYALLMLFPGTDNDPALRLILLSMFCYLSVVLVFKTRHRFNFIIPYVEFQRQQKGPRSLLLDTSAIIDGRIADLADAGAFDTPLIIPRFVLKELQAVADSADRLKRVRGRRGLDIVDRLQKSQKVEVGIEETDVPGADTVDMKLVRLARSLGARLVTTDYNLNKIAQIQEVSVVNINDIANALRPAFLPGEDMQIELVKEGEESSQAIGFLDDGTMVVVENGRSSIGKMARVEVVRTLQTSSGKMIFGRVK